MNSGVAGDAGLTGSMAKSLKGEKLYIFAKEGKIVLCDLWWYAEKLILKSDALKV